MKTCSVTNCNEKHRAGGLCRRHYNANYQKQHKEQIKTQRSEFYLKNQERLKNTSRSFRKNNKDIVKDYNEFYYNTKKDNILEYRAKDRLNNKEKYKEREKKYAKRHPLTIRAKNAKRRAQKLKATPPWANLEAIKDIYLNCPDDHHVDHIIPLQGKNVCGLHVENNLQYLTPSENSKKGNRV